MWLCDSLVVSWKFCQNQSRRSTLVSIAPNRQIRDCQSRYRWSPTNGFLLDGGCPLALYWVPLLMRLDWIDKRFVFQKKRESRLREHLSVFFLLYIFPTIHALHIYSWSERCSLTIPKYLLFWIAFRAGRTSRCFRALQSDRNSVYKTIS